MKMNYGLTLEQTQKLIMTPELRQAIKILQLSSIELSEYIEQAVLNNPVLEMSDSEEQFGEPVEERENPADEIDWEEYFQKVNDFGYVKGFRGNYDDENDFSYEKFVSKEPTLHEHLMFQLHLSTMSKKDQKIGEYIIGNLDKNGYLRISCEEIARLLQCSVEEVLNVLKIIQSFEPAGVGARDLTECLLIQIKQRGLKHPYLEKVVKHYLNDLADARFNKISEELGITLKEVQEIKDIIKTLEPKPGRNFRDSDDTQYVSADAVVEKVGDEYVVIIKDTTAPRLTINNFYRNLLTSEAKESPISKFLSNRLESALWLIKSIEQRRMTMFKVVSSIVEAQKEFFDKGVKYLKPLNLKDIADKIGVHESTVSRATNGKYVQTPRGIFELKYFFNSGINTTNGTATSSKTVKSMIKEIIEKENPKKPYSDQKIADILKQRGIRISRRTVAKYRDEMKILPSIKRKRY